MSIVKTKLRSFTLVEVLITMVLFSVLVVSGGLILRYSAMYRNSINTIKTKETKLLQHHLKLKRWLYHYYPDQVETDQVKSTVVRDWVGFMNAEKLEQVNVRRKGKSHVEVTIPGTELPLVFRMKTDFAYRFNRQYHQEN